MSAYCRYIVIPNSGAITIGGIDLTYSKVSSWGVLGHRRLKERIVLPKPLELETEFASFIRLDHLIFM